MSSAKAVAQVARPPLRARPPGRSARRKCWCSTARARDLFLAALAAKNWVTPRAGRPAVLIPNPFYAAYAAGAIAADCEPVYLPTTRATGFLPDLDALERRSARRARSRSIIASPSNPQGAVADRAYLEKLTALARRFGFLIFSDECYCEIYSEQRAARHARSGGSGFRQRRRVPLAVEALEPAGAAHRLCRGRPHLHAHLSRIAQRRRAAWCRRRCSMSPSPPTTTRSTSRRTGGSIARNSISPIRSSATVTAIAAPPADFSSGSTSSAHGGSEAATQRLWREAGLRVVPGRYLAREQADGSNPGADYIRVAMVQNNEITAEAMHRLVAVLG